MGSLTISTREAEVLDALAQRLTNAEIAERLVISVRTVEHHVSALLRKLGADNRRSLAAIALERQASAGQVDVTRGLPATLTSFVGRELDLTSVATALGGARLVTLVGPAGVGKTRLAVESARRNPPVPDVFFVDLTTATRGTTVLAAVAAVVTGNGEAGQSLHATVGARLAAHPSLLVLDNCEHVLDDVAATCTALLSTASDLRVLATSREPLTLPGERLVQVTPLQVPDDDVAAHALPPTASMQLFADRAAASDGAFRRDEATMRAVASICRQLDGIPLALELAAAQIPALTPRQIADLLGDRFRLLRGPARGRTDHHRTLAAAIAWSYDLLTVRERTLLDRLSVFRGTFTLGAAELVASGPPVDAIDVVDLVVRLVRKSLVVAEAVGEERHYRLLESMREFGHQRLADAGELATWREHHRQWMFDRMREASVGLSCGVVPVWLDVLDDDLDNIEAALEWSLLTPQGAAEALPVVRGLERYWMARGVRRAHGIRWSALAAERATTVAPAARVEGLLGAALLLMWSDLNGARVLAERAMHLADTTGDRTGRGYAALASAWVALFAGASDDAAALATRAAELMDPADHIAPWADACLAMVRGYAGDHAGAGGRLRVLAKVFRNHEDPHMSGAWLSTAADYAVVVGDLAAAGADVEVALHEARVSDCASCESQALASLVLLKADPSERLRTARTALRLAHGISEPWGALCALEVTVGALADTGAVEEAALLSGATRAARATMGYVQILPGRALALSRGEQRARDALGPRAFASFATDGAGLGYAAGVVHALS